ncbi:MAG: GNAT family N-acetyltransferase [Deltaproteobacteria bacterium]|jgi:ribosomal-protein-alanine N-acetyltransferase|nr:GNAT family N-acetyltransferase [Deltaproteobacteria bacterium]
MVTVTPIIVTQRLALTPMTHDDLAEWTRIVFADPDVMRYHNKSSLPAEERAARNLAWHNRNWSELGFGGLMITDRADGALLGDVYLGPADEAGEIELGYSVGREFWGRGIATEASRAMVRYGFENRGLNRIAGFVAPVNVGSWRVLEKCGFVFEREDHLFGLDVHCYAIEATSYEPDGSVYHVHPG